MRTLPLVVAFLLAGHPPRVSAAGGEPLPLREGLTVERIEVRGCRTVDPAAVEGRIRTRVGDRYNPDRCREDVKRILQMGLFENVRVEAETTPTGVVLTYIVVERRRVERLLFQGNTVLSERKLRRLVGLEGVRYISDYLLARACRRIEEEYRKRGYTFVRAEGAYREVEGRPAAVITIHEGPRVRVEAVEFVGVRAFPERLLRRLMRTKTYLPVLRRGIYEEETVREDVRRIREYYLRQGYLNCEISWEPVFSEDRSRVRIRVKVREGEPFRVASVEVRGARVFKAREIMRGLRLQPGVRYTTEDLEADRRTIKRMYGRLGYVSARVRAERLFAAAPNMVDVRFEIVEGQQIRLRAVRIEGNRKTRADVILREVSLVPGTVLDAERIEESKRRLERLRYFKTVRLDRLEGPRPDEKDLVIEVEEDRTADILLGVGYGTETGLMGSISYVQRNFDIARLPRSWRDLVEGYAFAGGGQTLRLTAQPGTELERYMVSFYEPHLAGSDYTFGLRGFLYDWVREDYSERRGGGRVALGRHITRDLIGEVFLRSERIRIDAEADAPPAVLEVAGSNLLTSLGFTLDCDRRDDPFTPLRGYRLTGTVEQAGAFGGDFDFTRLLLRGGWYHPMWRGGDRSRAHIVSLSGRLGFIFGDAPVFERFYAGGTYTMRGFEYRGLGPHQEGSPVGGDFLAVSSLEYSLPLIPRRLRAVAFLDVGTVEEGVELDRLRASAGFGLRLYLDPRGRMPMQFNFGFPLVKEEGDETQVFSFALRTGL